MPVKKRMILKKKSVKPSDSNLEMSIEDLEEPKPSIVINLKKVDKTNEANNTDMSIDTSIIEENMLNDDTNLDDDRLVSVRDYSSIYKDYDVSKNKTRPVLTKFEHTMMIGKRAMQLASGAHPLIEVRADMDDVLEIAEEELRQKKIPFMIRRPIGNHYEYWRIDDLQIIFHT